MPWRVNQVNKETRSILALLNEGQILFAQLVEQGDGAVIDARELFKTQNKVDLSNCDRYPQVSCEHEGRLTWI